MVTPNSRQKVGVVRRAWEAALHGAGRIGLASEAALHNFRGPRGALPRRVSQDRIVWIPGTQI